MSRMTKIVLATLVVLGSASLAQAASRPHAHPLQSRGVSLSRDTVPSAREAWMDRASRSFGGGGY
jgi:hypothetical protein